MVCVFVRDLCIANSWQLFKEKNSGLISRNPKLGTLKYRTKHPQRLAFADFIHF